MGVYAGPKITSDGLVLSLDAGNLKGYDNKENLVVKSSQIGVSPDYTGAGIIGLNTTATTAPNGFNEATFLDNDGNVQNYVYAGTLGLTTNTTYTYSIHIKQGTKPDFQITIDENGFGGKRYYSIFTYSTETVTTGITGAINDGVVIGSTATKLLNGWYRLSLTFTTSTTNVNNLIDLINRFGAVSGSNYVWGRQLERGSTANTYYPTTSTTKTRGTILTDLSGRGNNGTLTNGPTFNSANGGSLVFDGVDDYVRILSASYLNSLGSSDFTVSMWIYRATNPPAGNGEMIYQSSTLDDGFVICISDSNFRIELRDNQSTNNTVESVLNIFTASVWNNVVFTKQGTTYTGYSQGISKGSFTSYQDVGTNSGFIDIGRVSWWGPSNWEGNITQTQVYNRALTAAEIQQNFNALRRRFGL